MRSCRIGSLYFRIFSASCDRLELGRDLGPWVKRSVMEQRLCRRKRGSVQVSLKGGRYRRNTVGMYLVTGIAKFHHALLLRLF